MGWPYSLFLYGNGLYVYKTTSSTPFVIDGLIASKSKDACRCATDDALGSGATLNETAMKIKNQNLADSIAGLALGTYFVFHPLGTAHTSQTANVASAQWESYL